MTDTLIATVTCSSRVRTTCSGGPRLVADERAHHAQTTYHHQSWHDSRRYPPMWLEAIPRESSHRARSTGCNPDETRPHSFFRSLPAACSGWGRGPVRDSVAHTVSRLQGSLTSSPWLRRSCSPVAATAPSGGADGLCHLGGSGARESARTRLGHTAGCGLTTLGAAEWGDNE